MSSLDQNKIVIRLPSFNWRLLLSWKALLGLLVGCVCAAGAFWAIEIRPFLWVSQAQVDAYSVNLRSDTAGRIAEMGPREGDFVKKGEVLCVFGSGGMDSQVAQAKRLVEDLSQRVEREKERLGKAMEAYLTAAGELEMGIGSADVVKNQLALMEEAQEKAEAVSSQRTGAKRELDALSAGLKTKALCAPFHGKILKRSQNPGAVVSFGDPIYVLSDLEQIWIEAWVAEKEIGKVQLGSPVRIRLPAFPKKEFAGKVVELGGATVERCAFMPFSGSSQLVPVKISIEKAGADLKPGLSARVGIKVH